MKLSAPLTTFALLAPAALAASLPACSGTSTTPCSCPSGTTYAQSVTFAVIGAAATDVKALISDFFKTAWLGIMPMSTQGPDNQCGSTRTSNVPTSIGTYKLTEQASLSFIFPERTSPPIRPPSLVERAQCLPSPHKQLTQLRSGPSGSFIQKFEQLPSTVPVEYTSGNGSFSGYWITLESKSIFQYETAIVWSVYACTTGHPQNYALFHERALANATSVLEKEGKVLGSNVKPFSIQSF